MVESRRGWTRAWVVSVVVALAALLTVGATSASGEPGEPASGEPDASAGEPGHRPRQLRVATFNIQHGAGLDDLVDLERIAQTLEESGAGVIGLQEVDRYWSDRSGLVDQAGWLAERLEMHVVYGANLDVDPDTPDAPRRQYGTAILSRYPILETRNTLLPRPEGGEQRGLLEALIKVRGTKVRVFNTHLQHNSEVERLAQIDQIRARLTEVAEPVVLLGDLNATPDSEELARLTEDLVDVWVVAGEGEGYTYNAADPYARIDYVMSSSDVVANAALVMTTDASDHLPVVVDLTLPARRPGKPL